MAYYSGTSRAQYEREQRSRQEREAKGYKLPGWDINCWDGRTMEEHAALTSAISHAYKRARQDNSVPLVIQIVRESDFAVEEPLPYIVTLNGALTPENHVTTEGDLELLLG